ncbi:MAG: preprotein translocase subunit YajC [Neisseriales bacterium]|nr:MAG: preprotein translocase subunit YajC [Neisseriales bacterium]
MSLIPSAFADGAATAATGGTNSLLLPMVVIFVLFWFLLIRPQQRKMKLHNQMISALEKGNKVLTTGGIVGKIVKIDEQFMDLEIADNVVITIERSAIAGKFDANNQVAAVASK